MGLLKHISDRFAVVGMVWRMGGRILRHNPYVVLPFFIFALMEGITLAVLYYIPQPPFSLILAPPVRAFFGERFLHYPDNFLLLGRLFRYARIPLAVTFGMIFTAATVDILKKISGDEQTSVWKSFKQALKRCISLVVLGLVIFGATHFIFKLPDLLIGEALSGRIKFYISFFLSVIFEVFFAYGVCWIMIGKKWVFPAMGRSLFLAGRLFMPTFIIVLLPALLQLPVIYLKSKTPFLITKTSPEIVLVILGVTIAAGFVVNLLVTIFTTGLFLLSKEAETNQ